MIRLPSTKYPPSPPTAQEQAEFDFLILPYHLIPSNIPQPLPYHPPLITYQQSSREVSDSPSPRSSTRASDSATSHSSTSEQPSHEELDMETYQSGTNEQAFVYEEGQPQTLVESLRRSLEHGTYLGFKTVIKEESKSNG